MNQKSLNLLVVGDQVQSRRVHDLLFDLGHNCQIVTNGDEAFELVRGGPALHLLVTELSLPGRDGLSLVTELRKRWTKKQAAAVVITAFPGLAANAERLASTLGIEAVLLSKASALEISSTLEKALKGKDDKVALAPMSPDAFNRAPSLQTSNLSRHVAAVHAAIHFDLKLPREKALEKLVADAAEIFEMTGALVRLGPEFQDAAALYLRRLPGAPSPADAAWDFVAPLSAGGLSKLLAVSDTRASVTLKSQDLVKSGFVGAFASAPIVGEDGKSFGFLCLFDSGARLLSFEERDSLEALGKRLGREIGANAIIDEMRQNMAEQGQLAARQKFAVALLRNVLQALHLGVLLHGGDGKSLFTNKRLAEITGWDLDRLRGMDARAFHRDFKDLLEEPNAYEACAENLTRHSASVDLVVETRHPRRQVLRWTALPVEGPEGAFHMNLWEDITSEVDLQAQRAGAVTQDALTELLNRSGGEKELAREVKRSRRFKRHYTLMRIRLNGLAELNRSQGFTTADAVLQAAGVCLRRCLRLPDRAASWGGGDFMVLLPETNLAEGGIVAERIRAEFAKLGAGFSPGVSVGLACSDEFDGSAQCLAAADARMEAMRPR